MILFNDVVEIFDLADLDIGIVVDVVAYDRRRVGTTFVDRDLLGNPLRPMALRRKRSAALRSRLAVKKKSTVAPALSTARYKYFHAPLTLT